MTISPLTGQELGDDENNRKSKTFFIKIITILICISHIYSFLNLLSVPVTRIIHMHYLYTCFYNSVSYKLFVFISQIYCFDLLLFHGLFHILKEMKVCLYFIRLYCSNLRWFLESLCITFNYSQICILVFTIFKVLASFWPRKPIHQPNF